MNKNTKIYGKNKIDYTTCVYNIFPSNFIFHSKSDFLIDILNSLEGMISLFGSLTLEEL